MNKKIQDAINAQINAELSSAYMYLAMATYVEGQNWKGAAAWMKQQAQEEIGHAMRFYDFTYERGGTVALQALPAPKVAFTSLLDVFEHSLTQEKEVTKLIYNLYELSVSAKEYSFQSFLQWFIDEQVEEESSVSDVIEKIKLVGQDGPGLFLLDKELGERKASE